jgi:hypothetical protein
MWERHLLGLGRCDVLSMAFRCRQHRGYGRAPKRLRSHEGGMRQELTHLGAHTLGRSTDKEG